MDGYRVAAIRDAESRAFAFLDSDVLMQRAASGLATAILRRLPSWSGGGLVYGSRVLIVVGQGNNGGDALWAGERLARRGVAVTAWRTADQAHQAGWAALMAAGGREVDAAQALAALSRTDLVVDGVAGIGSRTGLTAPVAVFAQSCADARVPVVAVDLPSGLSPESPMASAPAFVADLTVTFGGLKLCHLLEPARSACGEVELVDLGLDLGAPAVREWTPDEVAAAWPLPGAASDKYSRGVVGLDTGSQRYPGAAVLGSLGAVHAGAGMVRYLGPAAASVVAELPNVVTAPGRVQSWVIGSGWGTRADGAARLTEALDSGLPVVVDADAIAHLHRGRPDVLVTPHAGELAGLLGVDRAQVRADPLEAVLRAVAATGCTVLLKGATQYVAAPGEPILQLAVPGPSWTAQAGSGDVLAGICGTLLAAGLPPLVAAVAAASVQALAAAANPGPLPPQELARRLPQLIAELTASVATRP